MQTREAHLLTIFIADESVEVRKRLVELVSDLPGGRVIGEAGNALDAIVSIQRLKPQVVIMDFRMSNGNSLQAVAAVRALNAAACIIKLSSFPFPQYREQCLKAGANYFFDKASESDQIVAILEQLLAKASGVNDLLSAARLKQS
ncbi:MAG: response regulator [Chloroflexi bacterium]|nr:MAG: response regulator [Chloroflexota bacterium]